MIVVTPEDIEYQKVHENDDRTTILYTTAATMIVFPGIAVVLRLACRYNLKAPISHDDVAIIVALLLCWALSAFLILCAHFGSGRHTVLSPVSNIVRFMQVGEKLRLTFSASDVYDLTSQRKMEYAIELTYCVLITTIKISILLFYRRVFINRATATRFRIAWYAIMTWCILWGISTFFAAVFQCTPVSYDWTRFTSTTKGTCVDFTALLLSTAIINIITDIAVLVLPMPIVWRLQIQCSQKIAVSGIFLLGGFVCIASIIRCSYLTKVVSPDPLWNTVDAGIWTITEPGVGIICASLPSLGPILRKAFPPLQALTRSGKPRSISSHALVKGGFGCDVEECRLSLKTLPFDGMEGCSRSDRMGSCMDVESGVDGSECVVAQVECVPDRTPVVEDEVRCWSVSK